VGDHVLDYFDARLFQDFNRSGKNEMVLPY
jgi:hypothetical protein